MLMLTVVLLLRSCLARWKLVWLPLPAVLLDCPARKTQHQACMTHSKPAAVLMKLNRWECRSLLLFWAQIPEAES
jgi:hypothetical protein